MSHFLNLDNSLKLKMNLCYSSSLLNSFLRSTISLTFWLARGFIVKLILQLGFKG